MPIRARIFFRGRRGGLSRKISPKANFSDPLIVEEAEGFFHARFVDGIDALGWNEDFVEREGRWTGLVA